MTQQNFRLLTETELKRVYQEHMKEDFPPEERKSLSWMLKRIKSGLYEPYGLFQGEELLAYAFYWKTGEDDYVLLDYFAVVPEMRNRGVGSRLLKDMMERFCKDGKGVFGEVEAPVSGDVEIDALRRRRLNFYLRAGFRQLDFTTKVFDVPYIMIAYGPPVADEALIEVDRKLYHSSVPDMLYQKKVFIPEAV